MYDDDRAALRRSTLDVSDIPLKRRQEIGRQLAGAAAVARAIVDGFIDPLADRHANDGERWLACYQAKG